jgi:hypothetical protein
VGGCGWVWVGGCGCLVCVNMKINGGKKQVLWGRLLGMRDASGDLMPKS